MQPFGFYTVQNNCVDIIEFLTQNFENFAALLVPKKKPAIIIASTEGFYDKPTLKAPLVYSLGLEFTPEGSNQSRHMENVLILDPAKVKKLFAGIKQGDTLIALWQTVLHELRHFVQAHILAPEDFLPVTTLHRIRRVNTEIADTMERQIQAYPADKQHSHEVDATICAGLVIGVMAATGSKDQIDESAIKHTLLVNQANIETNPDLWISF